MPYEEVLVELPENKAPNATRAIPDNNNSMPLIIVSIAIIVTPVGLCCLFCIILDNVRFQTMYICCMIHNTVFVKVLCIFCILSINGK